MKNPLGILIISFPAVFLFSCQEDPIITSDPLDDELRIHLEVHAPTDRIDYFKLPDADDFSAIPQDLANPLSAEKVHLGQNLFHETGLGIKPKQAQGMRTYSCASCHHVDAGFQAGRKQGIGEGGMGFGISGEGRVANPFYLESELDVQPLRSPAALNVAFQKVMLWGGKFGAKGINSGTEAFWTEGTPLENNHFDFEGIETQALAGMGVHRLELDTSKLFEGTDYRQYFDQAFPQIEEDQRYTQRNAALAIAAYERTLLATQAPFQRWIRGELDAMNAPQKRGAILFFGKAKCVGCHTGPALSSVDTVKFHVLGMNDLVGGDVFQSNPEAGDHLGRGGFTQNEEDMYAFKIPQLYNLKDSPFYGHGGSFTRIQEVVAYKNAARKENQQVPQHRLDPRFKPLGLSSDEIEDISTFLAEALYDPDLIRYVPNSLPSQLCFPNNDMSSQEDLGCN